MRPHLTVIVSPTVRYLLSCPSNLGGAVWPGSNQGEPRSPPEGPQGVGFLLEGALKVSPRPPALPPAAGVSVRTHHARKGGSG